MTTTACGSTSTSTTGPSPTTRRAQRRHGHHVRDLVPRVEYAGNVVADNGVDGIRISGSTNTEIWNNTGVRQRRIADRRVQQHKPGAAPTHGSLKLGITWNTTNVRAFNNVLADGPATTGPLFNSFDASRPRHLTTLQMVSADRDNMFVRSKTGSTLASWQTTLRSTTQWPTLATLQAATGREQGTARRPTPGSSAASLAPASDGQVVSNMSGLALPLGRDPAARGHGPRWASAVRCTSVHRSRRCDSLFEEPFAAAQWQ